MDRAIALPPGWRHRHKAETGSTNTDALEAARAGDGGRLWITAARQSSGRGRQARIWVSEPGNLYATALLIDPADPVHLGTLPFVAALALHAALSGLPGMARRDLKLKWPNDILVDGAKISGILLEADRLPSGQLAIASGFGVNLAHHPDTALYPATDLRSLGLTVEAPLMLARLADNLDAMLAAWDRGRNFAAIRTEWLRHARGIGAPVIVALAGKTFEGIFEDIDMDGCLCLRHTGGTIQKISAGDVFFPQSPGAHL